MFKNSLIPQSDGKLKKLDLLVEDGKIKEIKEDIRLSDAITVNVEKKIVFPAFIDIHCHFKLRVSKDIVSSDDFETGTKAHLAGGVGIIGDFTEGNESNPRKDLELRLKDIPASYCHYIIHCVVRNIKDDCEIKRRLRLIKEVGFRSIKIFTAYGRRQMRISDAFLPYLLDFCAKNDIVVCIHAEDDDVISYNQSLFRGRKIPVRYHNVVRDEFSENYSVLKLLKLNERFNAKLYFVHISSFKSFELIYSYRIRGYKVYAETCPQYFVFDDRIYKRKDNYLFTFTPPVRDMKNKKLLLENLRYIDTISTDSCGFNRADKLAYKDDLLNIPMGISTLQLTPSIVYTLGVKKGRLDIYQMQQVLSTNPARIFSIKNKGEIKKGYDADLCIFDPDYEFVVSNKNLLHRCDYSCYEGMRLSGRVESVYLGGRVAYSNGYFSKPSGSYLNPAV